MTDGERLILAELRAIRKLIERQSVGIPAAGNPKPELLLRAIHDSVRGDEFTVAELVRHAAVPRNIALRTALGEFDEPNSRRLGKLLASIAGRQIGSFIVEPIGKEHGALIWRVGVCAGKLPLTIASQEVDAHADDFREGVTPCGLVTGQIR